MVQLCHFICQHAHAAYTDDGDRAQHDAHGLFDRISDRFRADFSASYAFRVIQQALGREHNLGKTRALQICTGTALRQFRHRIADQIIVPLLAIHQQVMRVEMEAHVLGEIGQPEY